MAPPGAAPRRMSFVGLHAIAGCMDDQCPAPARLAQELVHPRRHLLDTPHRIQAMMRVPHIADHDGGLAAGQRSDRSVCGIDCSSRHRHAVAQGQGNLRRVLRGDAGARPLREKKATIASRMNWQRTTISAPWRRHK